MTATDCHEERNLALYKSALLKCLHQDSSGIAWSHFLDMDCTSIRSELGSGDIKNEPKVSVPRGLGSNVLRVRAMGSANVASRTSEKGLIAPF